MNGNNRPKVDLALNEEAHLKLLKDKCYEGTNSFGKYYLYSVDDSHEEKAFFASPEIHQQILEAGLKSGDEFLVRKVAVQNGKKIGSSIQFEVVKKQANPNDGNGNRNGHASNDDLKEILLQCVKDADFIMKNAEGQVSDPAQKLATALFIARTRMT